MISDRYLFQDKLGQGGSSKTYLALEKNDNKQVAIKILSLSGLDDWKKIELFEREAEILKQLNHPSIPNYINYFKVETEDNVDFCLVQQLAPGQSLATLVENGWRPDEVTVKKIAEKILNILVYLQKFTLPVIHRDIKPQNIIYQPDTGKLFLVDFGAVQDTYQNTVVGSTVVGTYGYMAPEQYRGNASLSSDLYGLGCTLLFLLTGQSPAELPQRKLKIKFRSSVKITSNFAHWLEKLIEPDITNRFPNAQSAFDVLVGKNELKQYSSKQVYKPQYTSIYFQKSEDHLTVNIPPALFWKRFDFKALAWITYYIIVAINIGILTFSNSWLGYVYGMLAILSFFADILFDRFLQVVNLIYLFALLIVVVLVRSEIVQLIPIIIIFFDTLIFHKMRKTVIKDFWFPTRVKIASSRYFKCLKVERKIFWWWYQDNKIATESDIEKAMNIEIDSVMLRTNFNCQFGYLLTNKEKKWLSQELGERFRDV